MVLRKTLWTHTYHQNIYESDPSKGLEIMRCPNKVPKSVTHDVTRRRTSPGKLAIFYLNPKQIATQMFFFFFFFIFGEDIH